MKTKAIFSVFAASLAVAFALGACDDSHHRGFYDDGNGAGFAGCSSFTDCNTCTAANGCGWCFNSDGTGACGDDANQCTTEWTWEVNYCRAAADASVATTSIDASPGTPITDDAGNDADADADVASDAADD